MGNALALRWIFVGALVAGTSYLLAGPLGVVGPLAIFWKGAGVALLAVWCALQARARDGWLIAVVMACGALGDVLIEAAGLKTGAVAFLFGHIIATYLYGRNQRLAWTLSQRALAVVLAFATPAIAYSLVRQWDVVPYALWLGIMAATAWVSRFPRYRVGLGAVMFVASDLLIFAKLGPLAGSMLPGLLIWPLYFAGQVLIAWGVVRTLGGGNSLLR